MVADYGFRVWAFDITRDVGKYGSIILYSLAFRFNFINFTNFRSSYRQVKSLIFIQWGELFRNETRHQYIYMVKFIIDFHSRRPKGVSTENQGFTTNYVLRKFSKFQYTWKIFLYVKYIFLQYEIENERYDA